MTDKQTDALRLADIADDGEWTFVIGVRKEIAAELRRLHAYCQELESHLILDCMTHVQNPAENEHVAGDVSKNGAELNMSAQQPAPASQQEAQEPVAWLSPWRADQVTTDYDAYGEHGIPPYTHPQL